MLIIQWVTMKVEAETSHEAIESREKDKNPKSSNNRKLWIPVQHKKQRLKLILTKIKLASHQRSSKVQVVVVLVVPRLVTLNSSNETKKLLYLLNKIRISLSRSLNLKQKSKKIKNSNKRKINQQRKRNLNLKKKTKILIPLDLT